jgi:hypothetical protein
MSHSLANLNWRLPEAGTVSHDQAQLAVLMDIREELRTLNRLLGCSNFTGIPRVLKRISANTAKPRKPRS